ARTPAAARTRPRAPRTRRRVRAAGTAGRPPRSRATPTPAGGTGSTGSSHRSTAPRSTRRRSPGASASLVDRLSRQARRFLVHIARRHPRLACDLHAALDPRRDRPRVALEPADLHPDRAVLRGDLYPI